MSFEKEILAKCNISDTCD